jgi:hypothetical protein
VTPQALRAHPAAPSLAAVHAVVARAALATTAAGVRFEYRLTGDVARLAVPARGAPRRTDRLWEHTCFEAFIAPAAGSRYYELNFSPSTEWAAYAFDGYRQGMRPLAPAVPPAIAVVETANELLVTADMELGALVGAAWPWRIGLTAVVEDRKGMRAYFALQHARDVPDFHDAAGFALLLDGSAR